MTIAPAPPHRVTALDRTAIALLGAAGFALSYDALRQMAQAVHVRGPLTLLFPLLIDGFIAYGIRALLVLRTAPLAARAYAWTLFGTATAASIWANALHAVRLNAQDDAGAGGLRLGDTTVGVLSTLAPLALAGAVHLYILIARTTGADGEQPTTSTVSEPAGLPSAGYQVSATTALRDPKIERWATVNRSTAEGPSLTEKARTPMEAGRSPRPDTGTTLRTAPAAPPPRPPEQAPDLHGQAPDTAPKRPSGHQPASGGDQVRDAIDRADRTPVMTDEDLLSVARTAVADSGQVTRKVVAAAIRGQGIPLSNDRLTLLMRELR
ncbi:DUF2637 domain-containing protein [Embleya sp. NPDC020630]|uniref:DUF2637 domain-containing protein n=1 Tax=Embleya sp. NPDC020630 TaxID=3363979 RepID=UPI0037A0977D